MKRINILLSIAIITFLSACSDSSSGTSGGAAPAAADVPKKKAVLKQVSCRYQKALHSQQNEKSLSTFLLQALKVIEVLCLSTLNLMKVP